MRVINIKVKAESMVVLCIATSSKLVYIFTHPYIVTSHLCFQGESPTYGHNSIPSQLPAFNLQSTNMFKSLLSLKQQQINKLKKKKKIPPLTLTLPPATALFLCFWLSQEVRRFAWKKDRYCLYFSFLINIISFWGPPLISMSSSTVDLLQHSFYWILLHLAL